MYDLVIVEDDMVQAEATASAVALFPGAADLLSVRVLSSLDELDQHVQDGAPLDVLIIDIVFDGKPSGIDAVKRLAAVRRDVQVIYATGYVEYCTRVYRTPHMYFLCKPLKQDELDDALARAISNLDEARNSRPLVLKSFGKMISLPLETIEYVESDRRKVRVHADGKAVEAYASIAEIERMLPASFVRCHKSFIVNLAWVAELDGGEAVLFSDVRIPVSQRHRREVRARLVSYLMAKE